ncbi:MAG: hypothetical protein ABIH25_04280 [Candidatus Woesearchaeota archaeon]
MLEIKCKECGAIYTAENEKAPTYMNCFCGCVEFKQTLIKKQEIIQEV